MFIRFHGRVCRTGFTLLELIVVIVVAGILAGLAIPSFNAIKVKMHERAAVSTAEAIVREARALAAMDDTDIDGSYIDQAGSEAGGYSATDGSGYVGSVTSGGSTAHIAASGEVSIYDMTIPVIYTLGSTGPAGGVIISTPSDNDAGLYFEVAPQDSSSTYFCDVLSWVTFNYDTTLIGSGVLNKERWETECNSGAAVTDYTINGFSDWVVPSTGELGLMWQKRNLLSGLSGNYFASSPQNDIYVLHLTWENGVWNGQGKTSTSNIRVIRSFS